ncbi:MAG: glycosyltransferase family 1 protein, partial [Methanococci archaeon]|nr:glycosyltransferase family 1 protein [Methanococci archaeon]
MKKTIAIIGLRGIPGNYGGTETFVEELVSRLKGKYNFYVMHEDKKFYEDKYDESIFRVHSFSIEAKSTSIPTINDFLNTLYICLKHNNDIDIFYFLGPDSSVASLLPKILLMNSYILINPDGVEWRRLIKRIQFVPIYLYPIYIITMIYMYLMEYLSCTLPDVVVVDSVGIKEHLLKEHNVKKRVVYIAYGSRELIPSNLSKDEEFKILDKYELKPSEYYLTVARIVAENNIHLEIEGFKKAKSNKKLVIVGNFNKKDHYCKHLFKLKENNENILLLNPIYDKEVLGVLRKNCFAYIHAYEVGGTNPSLLEQMLFKRPI